MKTDKENLLLRGRFMKYFLLGLYVFSFLFQIILTIYNIKCDLPKKLITHISSNLTLIVFLFITIFVKMPLEYLLTLMIVTAIWVGVFMYINLKILDRKEDD